MRARGGAARGSNARRMQANALGVVACVAALTNNASVARGEVSGDGHAGAELGTASHAPGASSRAVGERRAAQLWATQPLALLGAGLGLWYEREVRAGALPLSAAAIVGVRGGSGGDYRSRTGTVGAALRWWPLSSEARPMRRLGVSLSASAGLTSVTDELMDDSIGSSWTLTQRLEVSYRFVAWGHLALTPSLGFGAREDFDRTGRLAATARPVVSLGFELGWMR